jgi:hypothetical protein
MKVAQKPCGTAAFCRYDSVSQKFVEQVRGSGGAGILYDSLRRRIGINVVAFWPRNITDIMQTDYFEITVSAASRMIAVRRLSHLMRR